MLILHLVVLAPMWLCAQKSAQPATKNASSKANSAAKTRAGSPALDAVAAVDRYERSLATPANPNGPELARKARLANKASQADVASGSELEILLTQVQIISLDHMKMTLGRPAPLEADTAKYRKLRDALVEKLRKKQEPA